MLPMIACQIGIWVLQTEKRQQALDAAASLQAAAVTAAVAGSVVGSPRASGSATPSLPHTPTASTGGVTPRDAKVGRLSI